MEFHELNNDQRRETVNSRQRYQGLQEAKVRAQGYRGSMVWSKIKGREYLIRSAYGRYGVRRQSSLGARSAATERIKAEYDRGRQEVARHLTELRAVLKRQSAVNRAVGLGRVPVTASRIIRAIDAAGMLGSALRVVGTNAIYAYEATAGVRIDPGLTTTEDIDLLFDSRRRLTFAATDAGVQRSLLRVLQKVDRSYQRTPQTFRAANREGYLVDLIRPKRDPPWQSKPDRVGNDPSDLVAVQISGLEWHENAPAFESVAIDEKGEPLRIVTTDPRIWAAHKLWLSQQLDREPVRRRRDEAQARVVGRLVARYLAHLQFLPEELRMLPRGIAQEAASLFST